MEKKKSTKKCPRCHGLKKIRRAVRRCPGCDAKGVQIVDGVSKTCFECGGERFEFNYAACHVCKGIGRVPNDFDLNSYRLSGL